MMNSAYGRRQALDPAVGVEPAVRISGVRVRRGERIVLDDVDLEIAGGAITGLLGPSGSGKTTLIRAIVGIQQGVSGTVDVLGLPAGSPELRSRVSYATQDPSVYGDLTVRQAVRYFADVLGVGRADVDRVIDDVDLGSHAGQLVNRLSGGERARASLAVALLGTPELVVLDEPTVGLDPVLRRDLWSLFHRLADTGISLLVSSHVMDEAERCDRLILLREGRVLAHDTLDNLYERTATKSAEQAFLHLIDTAEQS
jgi:ABC-2 type transport system ATP-binding protein